MRAPRIITSFKMVFRMSIRKKIIPILMIVIPSIFSLVVHYTTSERPIPFQLAFLTDKVFLEISERSVSMVFMTIASAGFIASFLGLNLIQKYRHENRRLILCGYRPGELVIANLGVLIVFILVVSLYSTGVLAFFMEIKYYPGLLAGIFLAGFIYGTYGMAVGSVVKGELEGILLIVLLANIDAGWLQNPIFYADAQNKLIIEYLPAFHPSQTVIASAFSDHSVSKSILYSFLYGLGFLFISLSIFFNKMKLLR